MASRKGYSILPNDRFFQAISGMVDREIHPGRTVTFISEVDLTQIERIRSREDSLRPSYTAFVVKTVALALREFPYANRRVCRRAWLPFARARLQQFEYSDVAVACERNVPGAPQGVFADIIRDADSTSLSELTTALRGFARADLDTNAQWRQFYTVITALPTFLARFLITLALWFPSLWYHKRGGAAFVSSPAKYGVDSVATTWTSPIGVSFGYVKDRPVVRDGQVVPCRTFNLVLNFDRRIMAGAQAARFFHRMVEILENAETTMGVVPKSGAPGVAEQQAQAS